MLGRNTMLTRRYLRRKNKAQEIIRLILTNKELSADIGLMNEEEAKRVFDLVQVMFKKSIIESMRRSA